MKDMMKYLNKVKDFIIMIYLIIKSKNRFKTFNGFDNACSLMKKIKICKEKTK